MEIYLDNNATTRPAPEVIAAVAGALQQRWHNPSSVHRPGQDARALVELSRQSIARLIGAQPRDLVFTSGATESINLAIRGALLASPPNRRTIVTSAIEHESVRDLGAALAERGLDGSAREPITVRRIPILKSGLIDADALEPLLDDTVALVSIQWANNETGVIQPIERVLSLCRARRILYHCDGTQWIGKMPTDVRPGGEGPGAGIDLLSFSAHKMHGPKGIGALYIRPGVRIAPLFRGIQERERRAGTENVPGIAGFAAAAELARAWLEDPARREALAALRDRLESLILASCEGAAVNAAAAPRLWNTTNIAFPRLEAEALLLLLSERGLCASAGAACSSGSLDPSPVLLAMGIPEPLAHGSLRFSLSRDTTREEIEAAAPIIADCVRRLTASAASVR